MQQGADMKRDQKAAGLVIVLAMAIAACGGDDDSASTTAPPATDAPSTTAAPVETTAAPTETTAAPPDTTAAPTFEPTTLTLWSSFSDQGSIDAFQPMIERCQTDLPWLTIEYVGKDDMGTALPAAVEAGTPPDIVQADFSGELAQIAAGDLAVTVDDLMARDGISWDLFTAGGKRLVEFDGLHYGVPFSLDPAALFVNLDALAEVGIDAAPGSTEDLLAAAEALLVTDGDDLVRVGFVPDVDGSYGLFLSQMFDAELVSADGSEVLVSDTADGWVEALNWQKQFYDLVDRDAFQAWADGLGSYDSAENFFIAGELPLYFEGSYFVTWPDRFGNGKPENWTVVPLPGPDGPADAATQSIIASGNWFSIPRGVADVDASWEAIKCLATAAEEITQFELFVGNIPANVAALDLYEAAVIADLPEMQTFIDLVRSPAAKTPPSSLIGGALRDELSALIGDYRFGDLSEDDLRAALDELDSRYQEELDIELGG
jgi:ABC-type glycerol-3-phosphate transport system substrate-binding protein